MAPTKDFWELLGFGLMVFLICAGVGSCCYLGTPGARAQAIAVKP